MKGWFLFYSFIFNSFLADAQLKGRVIDSLQSRPLDYASVSVFNAENKLVNGKVTDSTGSFVFQDLQAGIYTVKIEFIGYKQKQVTGVVITKSDVNNLVPSFYRLPTSF